MMTLRLSPLHTTIDWSKQGPQDSVFSSYTSLCTISTFMTSPPLSALSLAQHEV